MLDLPTHDSPYNHGTSSFDSQNFRQKKNKFPTTRMNGRWQMFAVIMEGADREEEDEFEPFAVPYI